MLDQSLIASCTALDLNILVPGGGMPNEASWYVARGEEQAGPLTNNQLRAYAEQGDLKPDDQVWRPGFDAWQRAGDVPGLLRPPTIRKGGASPPPLPVPQRSSPRPPPMPQNASLETQTQTGETQPDRNLLGVRGWLLLLCVQLTILSPLVTVGQLSRLFEQVGPSFSTVAGLETFFKALVAISLVFVLASICVGVMLWSRRPGAHIIARWYLVSTFAWVCISPYAIYLFVRMPPGAAPGILAASLPELVMGFIVTFAWYSYLVKSKRVRANFDLTPDFAPASAPKVVEQPQINQQAPAASKRLGWVAPLILAAFFGFYHACTRYYRVDPPGSLTEAPLSAWRRIALPEGVALEIPTNWIVTGDGEREANDAIGKALFPSSTLKGRMGFGATLHSSSGKILAQVGIRFYIDSPADDVLQVDIETATSDEIRDLDENLRNGHERSASRPKSWSGTRRAKTGAFTSLVTEYVARFPWEQFERRFVRVRVYDGKLSFSLLLNYEEISGTSLRPNVDRIISSLARAT